LNHREHRGASRFTEKQYSTVGVTHLVLNTLHANEHIANIHYYTCDQAVGGY